ncbi:MAG: hypothetical protein K5647_03445, partial [Clostridiales bacterium]|nr:hypothetical protein [Clostridiales bacterium]
PSTDSFLLNPHKSFIVILLRMSNAPQKPPPARSVPEEVFIQLKLSSLGFGGGFADLVSLSSDLPPAAFV